jgi:hypothetical protein
MKSFKDKVINYNMRVFSSDPAMVDPKAVGLTLLTKVIPTMEATGQTHFAYNPIDRNVFSQSSSDFAHAKRIMTSENYQSSKGDTIYYYDFKDRTSGKMRRCIMTNEIWFKEDMDMPLSPIALLCSQFFGNGLHFTKCVFSDAPDLD